MGGTTKALNYARIIHRLLTEPCGWEVEDLRRQLNIGARAYRKYRLELQVEFSPYLGDDVEIVEVVDAGARWLRLSRPIALAGAADFRRRFYIRDVESKWSAIFFSTVHSQLLEIETSDEELLVEPLTVVVEGDSFALIVRYEGQTVRIAGATIKKARRVESCFDYPPLSQYDPQTFVAAGAQ